MVTGTARRRRSSVARRYVVLALGMAIAALALAAGPASLQEAGLP